MAENESNVMTELVIVTTSYPRTADGREAAGAFVSDLADAASQRVVVRVVAPGSMARIVRISSSLIVYQYRAPDVPLSTLKVWRPRDIVAIVKVLRDGLAVTRRACRDCRRSPRLLALWALPSGYWARHVARELCLEYDVWTLGSDIWSLAKIPGVRAVLRRVLADAKNCYSDGHQLAQDTARLGRRRVDFVPSMRKLEMEQPVNSKPKKSGPYELLFIGRWHPNKGIDLLLQALMNLPEPTWQKIRRIRLYGGGPLEDEVRCGTRQLRKMNRPVDIFGYVGKSGAMEAIRAADFLLIPSRVESVPLIFSDAMQLHCPVISMPVGDLPALVGAEPPCGCLSASTSVADYVAAISNAVSQSPSKFAPGVLDRREKFDFEAMVEKILSGL